MPSLGLGFGSYSLAVRAQACLRVAPRPARDAKLRLVILSIGFKRHYLFLPPGKRTRILTPFFLLLAQAGPTGLHSFWLCGPSFDQREGLYLLK